MVFFIFILIVIIVVATMKSNDNSETKSITNASNKSAMKPTSTYFITEADKQVAADMQFVFQCLIDISRYIVQNKSKWASGFNNGGYIDCSCGVNEGVGYSCVRAQIFCNDSFKVEQALGKDNFQKFTRIVSIKPFKPLGEDSEIVAYQYNYNRTINAGAAQPLFKSVFSNLSKKFSTLSSKQIGAGEYYGWKMELKL